VDARGQRYVFLNSNIGVYSYMYKHSFEFFESKRQARPARSCTRYRMNNDVCTNHAALVQKIREKLRELISLIWAKKGVLALKF
jgi:hypothetical protein